MKRIFLFLLILWSMAVTAKPKYIVVAYVSSGGSEMPDPTLMTHINYAFGIVNETYNGVTIDNPERLKQIAALKKQNRKLHVLLSIGGWGAGGFSEMAADEQLRWSFAKDCKRVIDEYGLDGIDMDWEYPSGPEEMNNHALLMRDIRRAIGKKKELTFASMAYAECVKFKEVLPYVDFVNVMCYDMGYESTHHSSLYPCSISGFTCEAAINRHLEAGIPIDKQVMGMPFYARGVGKYSVVRYNKINSVKEEDGLEECWEPDGCVPYIRNKDGDVVMTYDNPRSISLKCKYIKDKGLRGGMYWVYGIDGDDHPLASIISDELIRNTELYRCAHKDPVIDLNFEKK